MRDISRSSVGRRLQSGNLPGPNSAQWVGSPAAIRIQFEAEGTPSMKSERNRASIVRAWAMTGQWPSLPLSSTEVKKIPNVPEL